MNAKKVTPKKSGYIPNARPVWCGEWTAAERKLLDRLTTEERRAALLAAAKKVSKKSK